MALSQDQLDKLTAEAELRGVDARKLIAAAESESGSAKKPAKDGKSSGENAAEEIRIFAYHHPFMTVAEVRDTLGLPPDGVPDPGLTTGAWLAKHGGGTAPASPPEQE